MYARIGVAVLLAWLCACGPNHQKTCDTSIRNRAAGTYEDRTPEEHKKIGLTYGYGCASVCYDLHNTNMELAAIQTAPVCVESDLLTADGDPLKGSEELAELCKDYGVQLACTWLSKNEGRIAGAKASRDAAAAKSAADDEAARKRREENPPPEATLIPEDLGAIERAAQAIIAKSSSEGYGVQNDTTYSLRGLGSVSTQITLFSDNKTGVAVIGSRGYTFTANIGGAGWSTLELPTVSITDDAFVRFVATEKSTSDMLSNPNAMYLRIKADGPNQGTVRVVIFREY